MLDFRQIDMNRSTTHSSFMDKAIKPHLEQIFETTGLAVQV